MDNNELRITAELAHLEMSDDELNSAQGAFGQMLEYFQAMQNAGAVIDGLDAQADKMSAAQAGFRADVSVSAAGNTAGLHDDIVGLAPERDSRFIVIPNVL